MKQTKAELIQKLAWAEGSAKNYAVHNDILAHRLFSAKLDGYSLENKLATSERERDNLKTQLDEERDEVSRLRRLLAERIEYDRMRPPAVVAYCIDARGAGDTKRLKSCLS